MELFKVFVAWIRGEGTLDDLLVAWCEVAVGQVKVVESLKDFNALTS